MISISTLFIMVCTAYHGDPQCSNKLINCYNQHVVEQSLLPKERQRALVALYCIRKEGYNK